MEDFISREALKKELMERDFYPVIVKRAIEAVPAADVRPVEWISVEERLPEFGQVVLAVSFERNMYRAVRLERIGGEGVFWTYDGEHGFCFEYFNYWMPLPQPPQDRKGERN